ncbi:MAG: hypothetical protein WC621_04160 [Patescibacteria group bacterium]
MSKITKIVYVVLFIILLLMPHFSRHVGDISQAYVESIVMLVIFGIAYLTYFLNKYELRKHEEQTRKLEQNLQISEQKLLESFEYIGTVNRRLPLFKNLSSDLLDNNQFTKKYKKGIFDNLLATAVISIAQAKWGVFRFVEVAKQRTVREFIFAPKNYVLLTQRIGNKDLIVCRNDDSNIKKVGNFYIIPTSDQVALIQNFLILPQSDTDFGEEYPILRAITDQAQLFYKYLFT